MHAGSRPSVFCSASFAPWEDVLAQTEKRTRERHATSREQRCVGRAVECGWLLTG
nr:MAG TPA: hypothetical protein [Caudoviricetes sp.]